MFVRGEILNLIYSLEKWLKSDAFSRILILIRVEFCMNLLEKVYCQKKTILLGL